MAATNKGMQAMPPARGANKSYSPAEKPRFEVKRANARSASRTGHVREAVSSPAMTIVPDVTDEMTYLRLIQQAQQELREDRRTAQSRALRSLFGLR